jgi:hypothetical protein
MQRDYVVQIRPETDVRGGQFEGRVEHIDSGRSAHFRTVEDLVAFVIHVDELTSPSPRTPPGEVKLPVKPG